MDIQDKRQVLIKNINFLNSLIEQIEPFKNDTQAGKISNQLLLDGWISEKNTYSQLLAELEGE